MAKGCVIHDYNIYENKPVIRLLNYMVLYSDIIQYAEKNSDAKIEVVHCAVCTDTTLHPIKENERKYFACYVPNELLGNNCKEYHPTNLMFAHCEFSSHTGKEAITKFCEDEETTMTTNSIEHRNVNILYSNVIEYAEKTNERVRIRDCNVIVDAPIRKSQDGFHSQYWNNYLPFTIGAHTDELLPANLTFHNCKFKSSAETISEIKTLTVKEEPTKWFTAATAKEFIGETKTAEVFYESWWLYSEIEKLVTDPDLDGTQFTFTHCDIYMDVDSRRIPMSNCDYIDIPIPKYTPSTLNAEIWNCKIYDSGEIIKSGKNKETGSEKYHRGERFEFTKKGGRLAKYRKALKNSPLNGNWESMQASRSRGYPVHEGIPEEGLVWTPPSAITSRIPAMMKIIATTKSDILGEKEELRTQIAANEAEAKIYESSAEFKEQLIEELQEEVDEMKRNKSCGGPFSLSNWISNPILGNTPKD